MADPRYGRLRAAARSLKARAGALPFRFMTVERAFSKIYASRAWGTAIGSYNSGSGSEAAVAAEYVAFVRSFVRSRSVDSIVDIGCGDFRVSREIVTGLAVTYVGVDVVPELIAHNKRTYGDMRTHFVCGDAITDELPQGDLCLVRQVLQHLDNDQIAKILKSIGRYRYCIVTEHVPASADVVANRNKAHGPDVRLYRNSGVFIERPPFSVDSTVVLSTTCPFNGREAVIRSSLILNDSVS